MTLDRTLGRNADRYCGQSFGNIVMVCNYFSKEQREFEKGEKEKCIVYDKSYEWRWTTASFSATTRLEQLAEARAKSQLNGSVVECPFASEDEEFLANIFNILTTVICGRSTVNLATV